MLLPKQVLTYNAKQHFRLFRDPFADDVIESIEDIFVTPDIRYVRESLYQTASHGGFIAIVGESGSGKTTLRRDMKKWIHHEKLPIIVIEPYVIGMEDNNAKGRALKAANIVESIIKCVAPQERIKCSLEARYRQLHQILIQSSRSGVRHVLVIEEAHSLPISTLKHLKRFFELEDGFKKLLSVILIGQPELKIKLSSHHYDVREVFQRCEVIELLPIEQDLEEFINFKFLRAGKNARDIMDVNIVGAIRMWFMVRSKHGQSSLSYPLSIGNLLIAAMNFTAEIGAPLVNEDVIKEIMKFQ